jgi:hypothetical protein
VAIAQAVSRRHPTAEAWVRFQVRPCGIYGGQSGTRAGFLRVIRFPLPIRILPTAPHSSSSVIRGWYNRKNSGRRIKWTQSHPTSRNKKINTLTNDSHVGIPRYSNILAAGFAMTRGMLNFMLP